MKEWMDYQTSGIGQPEMDKTIRITSKRMNSEGNLGTGHLKVGELAKEVQMAADFKLSNTLCSKLLHQTAWSLVHREQYDGEYAAFPVILFESGSRYGLEAFNAIRECLGKPHPPRKKAPTNLTGPPLKEMPIPGPQSHQANARSPWICCRRASRWKRCPSC